MSFASIRLADGEEDPGRRTPLLSLVLAYLPMLPLVAGAILAWADGTHSALVVRLCAAWAGALICFLAGVRRGLSFRQESGPTLAQLATMLWLFMLGAASLLSPWVAPALLLQLAALFQPGGARPDRRQGGVKRRATSRGSGRCRSWRRSRRCC